MHNNAKRFLGKVVVIIVGALWLSACNNIAWQAKKPEVLPRLSSPWMPVERFSLYQQVEVIEGKNRYHFESAVEFTAGELRLVMLNELGQRVATIEYNGRDQKIDRTRFLPDTFDPDFVLEAIQMVYWPLDAFADQGADGWHLTDSDNGMSRRVYYQGRLVVEISYDVRCPLRGMARYHHKVYDFYLNVNSSVIENPDEIKIEKNDNERCLI